MPVLKGFLVETHKQDFLFSFNEKQHQVITFRHLDVIISDAALARTYSRASKKRQTKEKMLYLVRIKIPKVISKDYFPSSEKEKHGRGVSIPLTKHLLSTISWKY